MNFVIVIAPLSFGENYHYGPPPYHLIYSQETGIKNTHLLCLTYIKKLKLYDFCMIMKYWPGTLKADNIIFSAWNFEGSYLISLSPGMYFKSISSYSLSFCMTLLIQTFFSDWIWEAAKRFLF